ncbi:MAG: ribonuclease H family protein, partial [Bacteroidota bacterium]
MFNKIFALSPYNSVFQAETTAINECILFILRKTTTDRLGDAKSVVINVDNQGTLRALESCIEGSKLVSKTRRNANKLGEKMDLKFVWVRAHCGVPGNETADRLAKAGTKQKEIIDYIPVSYVKGEVKKNLKHKWQREWRELHSCRQTKMFFPNLPTKQTTRAIMKLSKPLFSSVVRHTTGFSGLRYIESKIGSSEDKVCRLCNENDETSFHIIMECPRLNLLRRDTLGDADWSVKGLAA